jgi:SAM-dependent methyltransferase
MASIAAARARSRGLDNVRTATLDLEQIDEPDSSYDVVLCREGLMFAVQPDCAVNEMHRVLRPGGRIAIAVWGAQIDNPWLGIVFEALTAITGSTVPPPGVPGPFALDDEAHLGNLMQSAGFVDIAIDHLPTPLDSPSFEAWWARTSAVAGPVAAIIARLDDTTKDSLEQRLRAATAQYTTSSGLQLPGLTVLASARRP